MTPEKPKRHILLLCNRPKDGSNAGTIIDHIDSFRRYSSHQVCEWSSVKGIPEELDLGRFDALVIHYSIPVFQETYLPRETALRIARYRGLKILFVQDEYRRVDRLCASIQSLGIDLLYSVAPEPVMRQIYGGRLGNQVQLRSTLTGFVPEAMERVVLQPIKGRPIDVGYRARKCPYWLGRHAMEKAWIGEKFDRAAPAFGLRCDISSKERDRLYGEHWFKFLANCRATLGTESGTSLVDFTGKIEYRLDRFQAFHPFARFEDVPGELLREDGNVPLFAISPRCFESAAFGTAMIMYPGAYSGVLAADRHYIPLAKDHSNMAAVVSKLRDDAFLQELADRTRREIVESGKFSYRSFIKDIDEDLNREWEKRGAHPAEGFGASEWGAMLGRHSQSSLRAGDSLYLRLRRQIWRMLPTAVGNLLRVTLLKQRLYG